MINKISYSSNNIIAFKSNNKNDDKINYFYEETKARYADSNKITAVSGLVGILSGVGAKLAHRSNTTAFNIGVVAYLASNIMLNGFSETRNKKESKEFYKNYMQDIKYKNKFDEYISKNSIPIKVDFGNEEKNKTYFELAHASNKRGYKNTLISLGVGALGAGITGIIFALKKGVTKNIDKICWAGVFSMLSAFIVTDIKDYPIRKKEYEEQKTQA